MRFCRFYSTQIYPFVTEVLDKMEITKVIVFLLLILVLFEITDCRRRKKNKKAKTKRGKGKKSRLADRVSHLEKLVNSKFSEISECRNKTMRIEEKLLKEELLRGLLETDLRESVITVSNLEKELKDVKAAMVNLKLEIESLKGYDMKDAVFDPPMSDVAKLQNDVDKHNHKIHKNEREIQTCSNHLDTLNSTIHRMASVYGRRWHLTNEELELLKEAVYSKSGDGNKRAGLLRKYKDFVCPRMNGRFPDPDDCTKYFQCDLYVPESKQCVGNYHFSKSKEVCDHPKNAKCKHNNKEDMLLL